MEANMASPEQELKQGLQELGLTGNKLEQTTQQVLHVRETLLPLLEDLTKRKLPRSLAIAQDLKAGQLLDDVTDLVVNEQGLLFRAMKGEDIHDALAVIKAKLESLLVDQTVEARTTQHLSQTTKRISAMKRLRPES